MPIELAIPQIPPINTNTSFVAMDILWWAKERIDAQHWSCHSNRSENTTFTEDEINAGRVYPYHKTWAEQPEMVAYNFLIGRNVGDIIHRNVFERDAVAPKRNAYVRGRIEVEGGKAYMMPIEIVGDWNEDTLPQYDDLGEFRCGSKAIEDVAWKRRVEIVAVDQVYEANPTGPDPKDWEPVSLLPLDRRDYELIRLREVGKKLDHIIPRGLYEGGDDFHPLFGPYRRPGGGFKSGFGSMRSKSELRGYLTRIQKLLNENLGGTDG